MVLIHPEGIMKACTGKIYSSHAMVVMFASPNPSPSPRRS